MRLKLLALLVSLVVVMLVTASNAGAKAPLRKSRPLQVVCEKQDGTFSIAVDSRSLYCNKVGGFFTAFTPGELERQRKTCERVYGAFFGVQGFVINGESGTGTFCSVA
jgi:hypothetical protein